tara:strand:+ start:32584 stop:33837 length:1254 start_codon:yes stop_codon:yes gene_type:complete
MTEEEKKRLAEAEAKKAEFKLLLRAEITEALASQTLDATNAQKAADDRITAFDKRMDDMVQSFRKHDLPGTAADEDGGDYSLGRVYQGLAMGDPERYCPKELDMSRQLLAQGTVPDSSGGFLVPTQVFEDQIIPLLRPQVVAMDLGITQLPVTGAGIVEIPTEVTGPTVDTVAENSGNTSSDMVFGNHRMEPHTAQSYIKASRRFLSLGVGADQFIRRRMAEELALKWNAWILKGTGADGEPVGIYNTAGVNTTTFTGATATAKVTPIMFTKMLEMEDDLADANALSGAQSLGWAVANKFLRACRQIESGNTSAGATATNLDMNRKIFSAGAEEFILGYKYRRTTQLSGGSSTEAIFGDWSKAVLATWNNLSIEASNVANDALQNRQTHIVGYIDVDVAVTQPSAFSISAGLDTSGL